MYQSKDPIHQRILLGTKAAAIAAAERARQTGTTLVVWRNNQVVEVTPDEFLGVKAHPAAPEK